MTAARQEKEYLSLDEYASSLAKNRKKIVAGSPGSFWMEYESGAMIRIPIFSLVPPEPSEIRQLPWRGRSAITSYLMEPDEAHNVNAWLYIYHGPYYNFDALSKTARRDVRRAQRNLTFSFLPWSVLLAQGFPAYRDTRKRVGLSDGTSKSFQDRFKFVAQNPAHYALGAWKDDVLVAFMWLLVVDDWVSIESSYSTDDHLNLCPNNGLAHYVLDFFIAQRGFRLVSYGLSSIQDGTDTVGLHTYKTKVGFVAQPVHRVFIIHPLLRPFVNRFVISGVKKLLQLNSKERRLKKLDGVLASLGGITLVPSSQH
jgi:hypothetical protein